MLFIICRAKRVNNDNNRIQRRYSRFLTISSQRREPSPTRTIKWPARAQLCANHVHHIERWSRASVMLRATWHEGTAQLLSLAELKLDLFELVSLAESLNRQLGAGLHPGCDSHSLGWMCVLPWFLSHNQGMLTKQRQAYFMRHGGKKQWSRWARLSTCKVSKTGHLQGEQDGSLARWARQVTCKVSKTGHLQGEQDGSLARWARLVTCKVSKTGHLQGEQDRSLARWARRVTCKVSKTGHLQGEQDCSLARWARRVTCKVSKTGHLPVVWLKPAFGLCSPGREGGRGGVYACWGGPHRLVPTGQVENVYCVLISGLQSESVWCHLARSQRQTVSKRASAVTDTIN